MEADKLKSVSMDVSHLTGKLFLLDVHRINLFNNDMFVHYLKTDQYNYGETLEINYGSVVLPLEAKLVWSSAYTWYNKDRVNVQLYYKFMVGNRIAWWRAYSAPHGVKLINDVGRFLYKNKALCDTIMKDAEVNLRTIYRKIEE